METIDQDIKNGWMGNVGGMEGEWRGKVELPCQSLFYWPFCMGCLVDCQSHSKCSIAHLFS